MRTLEKARKKPDTEQINLLATPELVQAVEGKAGHDGMSKSDWIRTILAKAVGKPSLAHMPRRAGSPLRRLRNGNGSN